MSSGEGSITVKDPLQYAEEILCANWNPLSWLPKESSGQPVSAGIDGSDVDALMARLYRCQQA
jgi:hypothetical protein